MYYINNFLLYSVIGYIFEIFVCFLSNSKIESGFMHGPWTPIYGLGVIIILLIYNKLKKFNFKKIKEGLLLFLICVILLTFIEFIGGITIDFIFKIKLWDYSNLPLHIGRYISIEISLIWGMGSVLYIYFFKPITDTFTLTINRYITYVLLLLFSFDFIYTVITHQKII